MTKMNLRERDHRVVWHPFTQLSTAEQAIPISHASGVHLITEDGRKILDGVSSWWVNLHGHCNASIAGAIAAQATKLEHTIFAGFTHEPAVKLAENLLSVLPSNQSKVFFSDDGSTSVEVAIKMAIQYWHNMGRPRIKIVAIEGAYHGDTFGAMAIGERGIFNAPFSQLLFDVEFIDFPTKANASAVERQFANYIEEDDVAAFIFEPLIQGAGGMRTYDAGLLNKLVAMAKKRGVVCIADEVMTGFGRTGKMFASDYLDHMPDIFCLSKGITGGFMSLGVTTCSGHIEEAFHSSNFTKTFFHGHSYTGNPLACAAANASFELTMSDFTWQQIAAINTHHLSFMKKIEGEKSIDEVRVLGTILAIELSAKGQTGYDNEMRKKIYPFFLARNILLRPLGNVIYILPPYIITSDELNTIYNAIEEFIHTLEN